MSATTPARPAVDLADRSWSEDHATRASIQPGDFEIDTDANGQRWFWFKCPGSCGQVSPVALRPVVKVRDGQHSWEFDGNADRPTLNPSINHVGCWHGWLRAGVFTEC